MCLVVATHRVIIDTVRGSMTLTGTFPKLIYCQWEKQSFCLFRTKWTVRDKELQKFVVAECKKLETREIKLPWQFHWWCYKVSRKLTSGMQLIWHGTDSGKIKCGFFSSLLVQPCFHVALYGAVIKTPFLCNFPLWDFLRLLSCCRGHVPRSKPLKNLLLQLVPGWPIYFHKMPG